MSARPIPTAGAVTGTTSTRSVDDWRTRAGCLGHDQPDLWFTVGRDLAAHADRLEAKRICRTACPVRDRCLQHALDNRIPYGVWGGYDEDDRAGMHAPAARKTCGTGGGRTAHRRDGTPVCSECLAYESRKQEEARLNTWRAVHPLLERGLDYEQAAAELGLSVTTVRRAHQVARRQQRSETAA